MGRRGSRPPSDAANLAAMSWMLKLTAGAVALGIAGPAMAQGGYYDAAHYGDGYVRCDPRLPQDHRGACGEVRLDDSFFADAGGVGPAWIARGGGGGGGMVIAGAGASASAYASASASASVSVRYRGGWRGGGKRGRGGCGC